jgi:hypothetical protein
MAGFKQKVKEKIKQYSNDEYLDGYIKNEFLTKDGDADVILKVTSHNALFDARTEDNQLDLNSKIYDYIDNKTSMLNNDIMVHLHIKGLNLSHHDQGIVKHIINEHYAIELYKVQKQYIRYKKKVFKLIILGLFFLLCYALIAFHFSSKFFIEVFGFLFSFTLWEAFDTLIYAFSDIKLKREIITQKLLMEIDFEK